MSMKVAAFLIKSLPIEIYTTDVVPRLCLGLELTIKYPIGTSNAL